MSARTTQEYATLLLRLSLGLLFLAHAYLKLAIFGLPGTVQFFQGLGLPAVLAYAVIAAELLGGLALLAGFMVRPVALVLALIAFGAITAHAGNTWVFSAPGGGWEYPLFLGIVSLVQALLGAGPFALTFPGRGPVTGRALASA
jgi:putative oxidoreductase